MWHGLYFAQQSHEVSVTEARKQRPRETSAVRWPLQWDQPAHGVLPRGLGSTAAPGALPGRWRPSLSAREPGLWQPGSCWTPLLARRRPASFHTPSLLLKLEWGQPRLPVLPRSEAEEEGRTEEDE